MSFLGGGGWGTFVTKIFQKSAVQHISLASFSNEVLQVNFVTLKVSFGDPF